MNTVVHVVMYHYYAWKVLGIPTPWKKYITKLQIIQFMLSFVALAISVCYFFGLEGFGSGTGCAGKWALVFNALFNASLLVQFIGVDSRNNRIANTAHRKKG